RRKDEHLRFEISDSTFILPPSPFPSHCQSALDSSSAFTASATSRAEPLRCCSSPHFHWAEYASPSLKPRWAATRSIRSAKRGASSIETSLPTSSSAFTCAGISCQYKTL